MSFNPDASLAHLVSTSCPPPDGAANCLFRLHATDYETTQAARQISLQLRASTANNNEDVDKENIRDVYYRDVVEWKTTAEELQRTNYKNYQRINTLELELQEGVRRSRLCDEKAGLLERENRFLKARLAEMNGNIKDTKKECSTLRNENINMATKLEQGAAMLAEEIRLKEQHREALVELTRQSEQTFLTLQDQVEKARKYTARVEEKCVKQIAVEMRAKMLFEKAWKNAQTDLEALRRQLQAEVSGDAHMREHATNPGFGIFVVPITVTIRKNDFRTVYARSEWEKWRDLHNERFRKNYEDAGGLVMEKEEDYLFSDYDNDYGIKEYYAEPAEYDEKNEGDPEEDGDAAGEIDHNVVVEGIAMLPQQDENSVPVENLPGHGSRLWMVNHLYLSLRDNPQQSLEEGPTPEVGQKKSRRFLRNCNRNRNRNQDGYTTTLTGAEHAGWRSGRAVQDFARRV